MSRVKKSKISVLNWMGTLALCAIPGVNLIALICFLILGKSSSKRSFALAALVWILILAVAGVVLTVLFSANIAELAQSLQQQVAAQP